MSCPDPEPRPQSKLETVLEQRGIVSARELSEAIARCQLHGGDLTTSLLQFISADEARLSAALSECHGLPAAPVGPLEAPVAGAAKALPLEIAERYCCFPLESGPGRLVLAVAQPLDAALKEELAFALGVQLEERVALEVRIRQAISQSYGLPLAPRHQRGLARLDGELEPAPAETPLGLWPDAQLSRLPRPPSDHPPAPPAAHESPLDGSRSKLGVAGSAPQNDRRAVRRRGPLDLDRARAELLTATARDEVIETFFSFACQYFEYSALFAVHKALAEGLDACGPGADGPAIRGIGVPLDLPSSLSEAAESCKVRLTRLSSTGIDRKLASDLRRSANAGAVIVPICLKSRCALLLYADNGGRDVVERDVAEVVALAPEVAAALGRIIVLRKRDAEARRSSDASGVSASLLPAAANSAPPMPSAAPAPSGPARAETGSAPPSPASLKRDKSRHNARGGSRASELPGGAAEPLPARGAGAAPEAGLPETDTFDAAPLETEVPETEVPETGVPETEAPVDRARAQAPLRAPPPDNGEDEDDAPIPLERPPSTDDPVFLLARPAQPARRASAERAPLRPIAKPPTRITRPAPSSGRVPRLPSVIVNSAAFDADSPAATSPGAGGRAPSSAAPGAPSAVPSSRGAGVSSGAPGPSQPADATPAQRAGKPTPGAVAAAVDVSARAAGEPSVGSRPPVDHEARAAASVRDLAATQPAVPANLPSASPAPERNAGGAAAGAPIRGLPQRVVGPAKGAATGSRRATSAAQRRLRDTVPRSKGLTPRPGFAAEAAPGAASPAVTSSAAHEARRAAGANDIASLPAADGVHPSSTATEESAREAAAALPVAQASQSGSSTGSLPPPEPAAPARPAATLEAAPNGEPAPDGEPALNDGASSDPRASVGSEASSSEVPVTAPRRAIAPPPPTALDSDSPPPPSAPELDQLVDLACRGNSRAAQDLARIGAASVPRLMARFPGPVISERAGPNSRASECGPLLQALAHIGSPAMPDIARSSSDRDARVRRWATLLLGELPSQEACRAVVQRLGDDDPRVQQAAEAAARLLLDGSAGNLFRKTLFEVAETEDTPLALRLRALEHVAKLKDPACVPRLIGLLTGDTEPILHKALWALTVVTRHDFGRNVGGWKEFWDAHQGQHRIEWLIEALDHADPRLRKAAADELSGEARDDFGYDPSLPPPERREAQERYRAWWRSAAAARIGHVSPG